MMDLDYGEDLTKEYERKMNILESKIKDLELEIKEISEMAKKTGSEDMGNSLEERIYELYLEIDELEKKKKCLIDLDIS